jgi:uncharacterized protein YrrD
VSDPSSWLALETGTPVYGSGGTEVGHVADVVGDPQNDIFNGLMVRSGAFSASRYVPAEHVAMIYTDRVELDIDAEALAALDESGPQDL